MWSCFIQFNTQGVMLIVILFFYIDMVFRVFFVFFVFLQFVGLNRSFFKNIMQPLLGVLESRTGSYRPPVVPTQLRNYICPDCDDRVIFYKHRYTHVSNTQCPYYTNPTDMQMHIDANLRLQYWLQQGVTILVHTPCSGKWIDRRPTHSFRTDTIQLTLGDTIVCNKFSLYIYDKNMNLLFICKTKKYSSEHNIGFYTFSPYEILQKNYTQIQRDIDIGKASQVEIQLNIENCDASYCLNCVIERSMLSAKDKTTNSFVLPDNIQKNKLLHCPNCEKEVTLETQDYKQLLFTHKYAGNCKFYENPSNLDLVNDAMHKLYMLLRLNKRIQLRINCANCPNEYSFPLECNTENRMSINYHDCTISLFHSKYTEKYLFHFLPTENRYAFIIDPADIHALIFKHKRKIYSRQIEIPVLAFCPCSS